VGPPGSISVLGHRLAGYLWNLASELRGVWHVHKVHEYRIRSARFEAQEGFATTHDEGERLLTSGLLCRTPEVEIQAPTLSHHSLSLG
jgi:ribonuclease Z